MELKSHEADYVRNALESFLGDFGSHELAARAAADTAYRFRQDGGERRIRLADLHDQIARRLREGL